MAVKTHSAHPKEGEPKPDSHDDPSGGFLRRTPAAARSTGHGRTGTHNIRARAPRMRLVAAEPVPADALRRSYRRLADVFHDLLSEQSLDSLLVRIADTLDEIVPYEALHIYEADEPKRHLVPALVRSDYADEILNDPFPFGVGITGWAVEHREPVLSNQAHLDPRVAFVPGTPVDPEALIVVPLIARGALKGTLNVYRIGEHASFSEVEFELAQRLGDAAALALDNAHIRARLERGADRLADRPLQPPLLPRAPPARADARLGRAHERGGRDGRHRRLQEGQRRLRTRRRRRGAGGARRHLRATVRAATSSAGSAARSSP